MSKKQTPSIVAPPYPGPTGDHLIDTLGNMPRSYGMLGYDTRVIQSAIAEIDRLRAENAKQADQLAWWQRKAAHRCIDAHCPECDV